MFNMWLCKYKRYVVMYVMEKVNNQNQMKDVRMKNEFTGNVNIAL